MINVSVVTPTYNRGSELRNLYKSLQQQSSKNFKWIIIDDGSTDNTEEIVRDFKKKEKGFKIIYKKKTNTGKHVALNYAFSLIDTELLIIVDSDDRLTQDAIACIEKDWQDYKDNANLCGMCYKRMDSNGHDVCDDFTHERQVANYNDFIINGGIRGDKAEVFRSEVLTKMRFPEYPNETFLSEGVMWSTIAHDYDMVFINKPIYICDYLQGGLTRSGRRLRIANPRGGMFSSKEFLSKRYNYTIRQKNALLYLVYSRFAKRRTFIECVKNKYRWLLLFNYVPSFFLYSYWKVHYGDKK